MQISQIDFGPKDARHAFISGKEDEAIFERVFIHPFGISTHDFTSGKKCFVYGIKGSGKSAFLKYLQITLAKTSITHFVYFSDVLRELNAGGTSVGDAVPSEEISKFDNPDEYWSSFFFLLIARILYNSAFKQSRHFLEFVRRQTTNAPGNIFQKIFGRAPTLETWSAQISKSPTMDLDGRFENIINLEHFYKSAVSLLEDIRIPKRIYIFVDELEVTFQSDGKFKRDVKVAESLVRKIRDINEAFRERGINIYVLCAIRREVANHVIGGDAAKIVSDLGEAISWERSARDDGDEFSLHPLFEIVLNRILFSERPNRPKPTREDYRNTLSQYFPFYRGTSTQRYILDLTTYRPRDISILFAEARRIDGTRDHFEFETFKRKARKSYRDQLWIDFAEALRSRYNESVVSVFGKALQSLPDNFLYGDFIEKLDDFSGDPSIARLFDEASDIEWVNIFKDLYELGAIGHFEKGTVNEENYKFHFRGDTNPPIITPQTRLVKPAGLRSP